MPLCAIDSESPGCARRALSVGPCAAAFTVPISALKQASLSLLYHGHVQLEVSKPAMLTIWGVGFRTLHQFRAVDAVDAARPRPRPEW